MPVMDCDARANQLLRNLEVLLGNGNAKKEEWAQVERDLMQLINVAPDFPKAQFLLGIFYMRTDQSGLAVNMLRRSIETGALGPAPWLNLAVSYKIEHNDEEAAKAYKKALELAKADPDEHQNEHMTHAYHGLAGLHINAGSPNMCIHWSDKALAINPNDRFALWNKGLALLELGEWEEGFKIYDEAGFVATSTKPMERKLKTYGGLPKWDGTPGKTVICYGEQGVGDEIMFASMLPDLMKQCKVIIDCDPRLLKLFRDSFPDAEAVYPTSEIDAPFEWIKNHKVDAYLPMGSLGKWFRKKDVDFPKVPFLVPDGDKRAKWRAILSEFSGYKIGISYCGGLKKTRQDKRTIPLDQWGPILSVPGCHFFSLQYHPFGADEASYVGNTLKVPIHHWQDVIDDYNETAAFVKELDLVISVNTSLIHLCGALGVPTLCLTPQYVAWRYGLKGPNPFYGSVEMIRQSKDGEWGPVLRKAREILQKRTARKEAA